MKPACIYDAPPTSLTAHSRIYLKYLAAVLEDLEAKKVERGAILSSKAEELSRLFNELDDTLTAEQVTTTAQAPSWLLRLWGKGPSQSKMPQSRNERDGL